MRNSLKEVQVILPEQKHQSPLEIKRVLQFPDL